MTDTPYTVARRYVGQHEGRGNDLLNRFLNGDTQGMTSAEYAWCSRFVKQAAINGGVPASQLANVNDMARSWLKAGTPTETPQQVDVVVLSRGGPNAATGHVGFYEGTNPDGTIRLLSGNHNDQVASASYPASRVLGYRRLEAGPEERVNVAANGAISGGRPLRELPSPSPAAPVVAEASPVVPEAKAVESPKFDLSKLASLFAQDDTPAAPVPVLTPPPVNAFASPVKIAAASPYGFANGGQVRGLPQASEPVHAGPLHSTVPGRTDHLPITVAAGSFVLPADIVSSLGEGNTNAGMQKVAQMFPLPRVRRADGGRVPIAAAGGEFVIPPETVAQIGGGDLNKGHAALDQFVLRTRAQTIKRLRELPAPEKS